MTSAWPQDGTMGTYWNGWTLAYGRRHLSPSVDPTEPAFVEWVADLSRRLGEVQYFGNERGWAPHQWMWVVDGVVLRAYAVCDGHIPLFLGDPTAIELELGVRIR